MEETATSVQPLLEPAPPSRVPGVVLSAMAMIDAVADAPGRRTITALIDVAIEEHSVLEATRLALRVAVGLLATQHQQLTRVREQQHATRKELLAVRRRTAVA